MNNNPLHAVLLPEGWHSALRRGELVAAEMALPLEGLSPQALARAFQKHSLKKDFFFLLESQGGDADKRFSLLGGEPLFLFLARGNRVAWGDEGGMGDLPGGPAAGMRALATALRSIGLREEREGLCPLLGWLSYEAGAYFAPLPPPPSPGGVPAVPLAPPQSEPVGAPDLLFALPGEWAWIDPGLNQLRLRLLLADRNFTRRLRQGLPIPTGMDEEFTLVRAERMVEEWSRLWMKRLEEARRRGAGPLPPPPPAGPLDDNRDAARFRAMVEKAKGYLAAGDLLQVNLSHRLRVAAGGGGFDLYRRLSRVNPSPFGAYARFQGLEIACGSPERLFRQEGDRVETRPIAGTHPRGRTPGEDGELRRRLVLSEKEKAEHLMLVDLERNDLGRVCRAGSVAVEELMATEGYSHVHHIVSRVVGRLKAGHDIWDLLASGFPGGTITGAPKIRCMQVIRELEEEARGLYTGSLGYWDPFHDLADFNILIRTVLLKDGMATFQVGAGIVADSDPAREWEETLHKAGAIKESLGIGGEG